MCSLYEQFARQLHVHCIANIMPCVHVRVYVQVREHFLPPLLDAILGDYYRNVPQAREPEVLSTVTAIVDKLEVRRESSRP